MGIKGIAIVSLFLFFLEQDPPAVSRPTAPESRTTLPTVEEPYRTAIDRRDLIQQFDPPSPLEGIYELRSIVRPGEAQVQGTRGYLLIGRRYMSLHIRGRGETPQVPHLQATFRRYTILDDRLQMSTVIGHRNEPGGDILVEEDGLTEVRRYSLTGSILRIFQGPGSFMEFVRVE